MNYYRLVVVITSLVAILFNSLSFFNILLLTISTLLLLRIKKQIELRYNYATYFIVFLYWMPLVFMPAFHLVEQSMNSYEPVNQTWLDRLLDFGIPIFLFVVVLVLCLGSHAKGLEKPITQVRPISIYIVKSFLLFSIGLSITCYLMGIGRMGSESATLPFHLTGVVNLYRNTAVPLLFAIIIENFHLRGVKLPKEAWALFLLFCIIEIFAWFSKSIMVYDLLKPALLLYVYKRPSFSSVLKYLAPIVFVFLFLYPVIEGLRNNGTERGLFNAFVEAKKDSNDNEETGNILAPLNRAFIFDTQYIQDYAYISDEFFDFSKVLLLASYGGAAGFQTYVIDGYPPDAHHSSGTSAFMDPLLHGGKGLLYIVTVFLVLFAFYIDKILKRGQISIFVILFFLLQGFGMFINISFLYNVEGFSTILVNLVCIYIAYMFNFKKSTK